MTASEFEIIVLVPVLEWECWQGSRVCEFQVSEVPVKKLTIFRRQVDVAFGWKQRKERRLGTGEKKRSLPRFRFFQFFALSSQFVVLFNKTVVFLEGKECEQYLRKYVHDWYFE